MQRQVAHQRGLLVHLHEAQEAERQRIAGEIHDDTVQVMAAVNLRLQSVRACWSRCCPPSGSRDLAALDRRCARPPAGSVGLLVELDPPPTSGETSP
jgi:signal transduction histidine kinase